jgi:hypothetical protein
MIEAVAGNFRDGFLLFLNNYSAIRRDGAAARR